MGIGKTPLVWLALLWVVGSPGCSASNEEAPLADGLELQYEWSFDADAVLIDVAVKKDGEEHFLLEITTEGRGEETGHTAIRVDRFFKTEDGELAALAGHPLWLPPSKREPGSDVVADGSLSIRRKPKTWEGRNVLVAGGGVMLGTVEWYYEKKTGFLVGSLVESMGSGMRIKLVRTNVPGLQAALPTLH